jgi:hypothetical protein
MMHVLDQLDIIRQTKLRRDCCNVDVTRHLETYRQVDGGILEELD